MLSPLDKLQEHILDCNGIQVIYSQDTDGAGKHLKDDCILTIQELFPNKKFNRIYEWGCGPAFFAYSMLAKELCDTVCLSDIYLPALDQALRTAQNNKVADKVTIYYSDNWETIPETEQFDLVIASPPKFVLRTFLHETKWAQDDERLYLDKDWNIRREFYRGVKSRLKPDGHIIMVESVWGSGIGSFEEMINESGLKIVNSIWSQFKTQDLGRMIYYLVVTHK